MFTAPTHILQVSEDTTFGKLLLGLKSRGLRLATDSEMAADKHAHLFIAQWHSDKETVAGFMLEDHTQCCMNWTMTSSPYQAIAKGMLV